MKKIIKSLVKLYNIQKDVGLNNYWLNISINRTDHSEIDIARCQYTMNPTTLLKKEKNS